MEQRSALITAASRGIGAACARELSERGFLLVLMSSTDAVQKIAEELGAKSVVGSVTNPDDLQHLISFAQDSYGRIDAVVNNTGHPALYVSGDLPGVRLRSLCCKRIRPGLRPVRQHQSSALYL